MFFCFCLWLLGDLMLTQQQPPFPNHLKQISSPPTVNGVSVFYTDETETISVLEGDSVTLNTDVTEIHRDDQILWTFRLHSSETRIAENYKQILSIYDSGENERFRDRLQIDEQTGSLTITNINKLHSGLYKLQIISGGVKHKSFSIAVFAPLPVPVIIRDSSSSPSSSSSGSSLSNCSLVCSVLNVSHVTLSWYKGNSLLSSISVSDLSISLSLPLEVEYQDKNTYSCVLNNPIRNQTQHLNVSHHCQPNSESNQTSLLLAVTLPLLFLLFLVSGLVVLIFCRRRKYTQAKQDAQTNEEEVDYIDATFIKHSALDTDAVGRDQTVYSEVVLR